MARVFDINGEHIDLDSICLVRKCSKCASDNSVWGYFEIMLKGGQTVGFSSGKGNLEQYEEHAKLHASLIEAWKGGTADSSDEVRG